MDLVKRNAPHLKQLVTLLLQRFRSHESAVSHTAPGKPCARRCRRHNTAADLFRIPPDHDEPSPRKLTRQGYQSVIVRGRFASPDLPALFLAVLPARHLNSFGHRLRGGRKTKWVEVMPAHARVPVLPLLRPRFPAPGKPKHGPQHRNVTFVEQPNVWVLV